jgi:hypothetical protein
MNDKPDDDLFWNSLALIGLIAGSIFLIKYIEKQKLTG